MVNLKNKKVVYSVINIVLLVSSISALSGSLAHGLQHQTFETLEKTCLTTDAGEINFNLFLSLDKDEPLEQIIKELSTETNTIVLGNGSRWDVSNFDSIKTWEQYNNLIVTQNHAIFSLYKYALVNLDLNLAVPISLISPPLPTSKEFLYVRSIDYEQNLVILSTGQTFLIHSGDHGTLRKFHENNPVVLGANSCEKDISNPLLIIDVSLNSNTYLRASAFAKPLN